MISLKTRLLLLFLVLPVGVLANAEELRPEKLATLHEAIQAQDQDVIRNFKGQTRYLNARNKFGYTALQSAIRYGYKKIIVLLVELGADPEAVDADGRSALHHAALSNELGAAKLLISKGADIHKKDPYRYTPLHLAAREGNEEIVKLLLDEGANINATIDVGYTAIDLADQFPTVQDYLRTRGGKAGHNLPKQ